MLLYLRVGLVWLSRFLPRTGRVCLIGWPTKTNRASPITAQNHTNNDQLALVFVDRFGSQRERMKNTKPQTSQIHKATNTKTKKEEKKKLQISERHRCRGSER